jgi:PPE-repeat protein
MLNFAALPPEVNSGLMYTGPGAGPMLAAAAAWDALATELYSTASSYAAVISGLTSVWLGPSSIAMAAAAAPFVSWIAATAGLAEARGTQATAAVAAYEAAFAMTVPPTVIAANRALLAQLIATNFLGQNTPAIMATEAQYMEMWAQDAAAMYGYAGAAQTASTFTPLMSPVLTTNPAGLGAQGAAVAQAAGTSAGTSAQTVAPLTTAMSTPSSAAVPNAGLASTASSMSSTSSTSLLTTLTSSPTALTSGIGSGASMSTSGISMIGSTGALMPSVGPAASILGNQFQAFGSPLGSGFGSGTGAFGTPGMGSAAVTAGVGRAASVGMLSVPQSWASAAPAFTQVGSAVPGASATPATPAAMAGGSGGMPSGIPMLANAQRGTGSSTPPRLTIGHRPAVVPDPVYAG